MRCARAFLTYPPPLVLPLLVSLWAVMCLGPGLGADLRHDERELLDRDNWLLGERPWSAAFTESFPVHDRAGRYRPLTAWSLRVDRSLGGGDAWAFRADQLVAVIGLSLLMLALLRRIGLGRWTAGLATLIFASHPGHAELVADTGARSALLAAIFGLTAVYFALSERPVRASMILTFIAGFGAALSDSGTWVFVLLAAVAISIRFEGHRNLRRRKPEQCGESPTAGPCARGAGAEDTSRESRHEPAVNRSVSESEQRWITRNDPAQCQNQDPAHTAVSVARAPIHWWRRLWPLAAGPGLATLMGFILVGSPTPHPSAILHPTGGIGDEIGLAWRMTGFDYPRLLVDPTTWSFDPPRPLPGVKETAAFVVAGIVLTGLAGLFWLGRRRRDHALILGSAWLPLSVLPFAGLRAVVEPLPSQSRALVAGIALSCLLAVPALRLAGWRGRRGPALLATLFLLAAAGGIWQSLSWRNETAACRRALAFDAPSPRARRHLTRLEAASIDTGTESVARELADLGSALESSPDDPGLLSRRAELSLDDRFGLTVAKRDLDRLERLFPDYPGIDYRQGQVSGRWGRSGDMVQRYRRGRQRDPWDARSRLELGRLAMQSRRFQPAEVLFREALRAATAPSQRDVIPVCLEKLRDLVERGVIHRSVFEFEVRAGLKRLPSNGGLAEKVRSFLD